MTNPEFSDHSFDEIDAEFNKLIEGNYLQFNTMYATESLNKEKEAILDALVDHMITFNDDDITDDELLAITIDTLTEFIEHDFEQLPGINHGDEIVASGRTIAMLLDQGNVESGFDSYRLSDDTRIRGVVDGPFLVEIPIVEDLQLIMDGSDEELQNAMPLKTNKFGIALRLINASIEDDTGAVELISDDVAVCIPLNYPELKLHRVIRQEIV